MWQQTGSLILRYRILLVIILLASTAFMGYHASKVQMSYEFSRAIPTNNPKYKDYIAFKKQFGEDGNLLVIGVQTDKLFSKEIFNDYKTLLASLKGINGVESVLSVPGAFNLVKNDSTEKLQAQKIFADGELSQADIDSGAALFKRLPFYQGLLYNAQTNAYLIGLGINKNILASPKRTKVVNDILAPCEAFAMKHQLALHYSGLPLIRTQIADRIAKEMKWLLFGSLLLSAIILLGFFRSFGAMLISLAVVIMGVIWSVGTIVLLGYKITLLIALIPPLIVVIGIPNCIYFLNKYHIAYNETGVKDEAVRTMVSKMGIVTLFCNIAAAIGFAVFAFTKSAILKEFGVVAGINIMVIFFISLIFIPIVLSYLPAPKTRHTRYLDNKWLLAVLDRLEIWALNHRKVIYGITTVLIVVALAGMSRLRSEGFIVDDLPKTDRIYTDLKFFEENFKGVMPLEIVVDTKIKNGLKRNQLQLFERMDSLSQYINTRPEMARPLSIVEGLKFARQAYYDGDSSNYGLPNSFDISFLAGYLNLKGSGGDSNQLTKLVSSFMDTDRQQTRISVSMRDVGSKRLPEIINDIRAKTNQYFDSTKYRVVFTGSSITFLEGSTFIINGLKESILWAFLLIALCMLYLFKSARILLCSLIPNLIPLVITAGIMGWAGVALRPSTVLIFSVALGIAIDITIRFLVNYKQEQQSTKDDQTVVIETIHSTGISIIYTSMVLIAGFVIFCFSGFGGTKSLGWLTSLTLVVATITNLVLLPALLIDLSKGKRKKT
ncbi:efflux RND transporter permease subunit [Flavihumibacter profundi]|uniref:efflux RND transporter permease subunit n=1 Tax=Flavihumibacter profundi TaxID=2716883 RepID=UPI001CC3430E|nr:MMPL family transporter [Flavihumibacter profundi]MBZ5858619.1 MMPL family transporter [Flavihumibacter profundi]